MRVAVAATLIAASLAGNSYRVDDPPPDPSSEEAPAPPAECTLDNPNPACHPPQPHYHRGHGILIPPQQ